MIEKNHGHIITVASVMGITGARNMADYSASKFGAIGFSESLRQDLYQSWVFFVLFALLKLIFR